MLFVDRGSSGADQSHAQKRDHNFMMTDKVISFPTAFCLGQLLVDLLAKLDNFYY